MDEVRRDAARPLFVQHDRLALNPRQATDPGADGRTRAVTLGLAHFGEASIFQRLARRVDAEHDERIDLSLHLVVDALDEVAVAALKVSETIIVTSHGLMNMNVLNIQGSRKEVETVAGLIEDVKKIVQAGNWGEEGAVGHQILATKAR